jgi:LmbE family N-acetylglucosaminyl deacetylase
MAEQRLALETLGVSPAHTVRLKLPDSDVTAHEGELVDKVLSLTSSSSHILAPWPMDFHPDHEACGCAAQTAARQAGARLTFYFFWTWHRGTLELLKEERLLKFPLSSDASRAKAGALACHSSQLHHEAGEPILPQRLLAPARRPFEVYLDA